MAGHGEWPAIAVSGLIQSDQLWREWVTGRMMNVKV